jgi:hypothetical protein
MDGWPKNWRSQARMHPEGPGEPDVVRLLAESRRLTDKMNATRAEWAAGKGKDYSTALDFIISQNRRHVIIDQLRGRFRLVDGGKGA